MKKEKNIETEEEKYSFMQRLLYLFVIPLLFAAVLLLGYLTYQGKNVFEIAQTFIPDKVETASEQEDQGKKDTKTNEKQPAEKETSSQEMVQLEREINRKQQEITKLVAQLEQANKRIEDLETEQENVKASTKELAKLYEGMSTRKASEIILELEEEMAIRILQELSTAKTSSILGQMPPEQAARITTRLANEE
ncbi:MgtE intracellular N domain protein [Bacillus sp. THAF10]|nr:MgtE intracellular N domain protein [Bacillus sp. THAF10]